MKKLLILGIMAALIPSIGISASAVNIVYNVVPTAQSTNSTGFTTLQTPDLLKIDLPVETKVTIMYNASVYKPSCTGTLFDILSTCSGQWSNRNMTIFY